MSLQHSQNNVTITIGGADYQFAPLKIKHALAAVQAMNDAAQRRAMDVIPVADVTERVKVFRATCSIYGLDDLPMLASDPGFLFELLWQGYSTANPDATREQFSELFDMLDIGMLQAYADKLSGFESEPDPTTQAVENPVTDTAGQP